MSTETQLNSINIVIIDDNVDHSILMSRTVEEAFSQDPLGISSIEYNNPVEALTEITQSSNQVILMDYELGGSTGVDWLSDFVKADVGPVVLITSSGDEKIAAEAFRAGAFDYIVKSDAFSNPSQLTRSIKEALRKYNLERTNQDLSTRLKIANRDFNSKNLKLAELTETAHRFVEDVAHEFRTPLTVIKEFTSIITDGLGGEVSKKQLEYLNYITGSVGDLTGLIDDFLNSSRLRTNSICVHRKQYAVSSVIDSAWPMLQSRADSRSINLISDIEDDLPTIYVDSDKLQRSLINLTVNAIKFSETGGTVRISAALKNEHSVEISVHDEGPGLPPESVADLFERFNQGVADDRRLANGFGLGLSIVKELVSINLGSVDIRSSIGVGSSFAFTVPVSNNRSLLKGLLTQSANKSHSSQGIVVLSAKRMDTDQSPKELAENLAAMSYPMDLVMQSDTSDDVFLVGFTDYPEAFRIRIQQSFYSAKNSNQHSLSELEVKVCGSWSSKFAEENILKLLDERSPKEAGIG
ncbi:MAG: ATP-binding protein [Phycisphaerales bacterium]